MSLVDETLKGLNSFFGAGFHRRMVSGGMLLLTFTIIALQLYPEPLKILDYGEKLSNIFALVTLIIIIYAIGSIVEILSDAFLLRLMGGATLGIWAIFLVPLKKFRSWPRFFRYAIRVIIWTCFFIFLFFLNVLLGLLGRIKYRQNLYPFIKKDAKKFLKSSPESVKDGVSNPTGVNYNTAWIYFSNQANADLKPYITRHYTRNQDFASIVSALACVVILVSSYFVYVAYNKYNICDARIFKDISIFTSNTADQLPENNENQHEMEASDKDCLDVKLFILVAISSLTALIIVLAIIFSAYFIVLRISIASVLELLAIQQTNADTN